ncbi:MAG: chitobiase/beta-hexosaminidase C-terminal domain-containing protein [Bacteroidetes bacterium]|nr:chitobiase/beta-hexosaminidase C-terminal domain-containing protein [Bacteroidota bacterium]
MVWQDMPSSLYNREKYSEDELKLIDKQWDTEWKRVMDYLYNHPSIVMWVPYNEGWGQRDTEKVTEWTKEYDPSRLVNNASGWTDKGVGDVHDIHNYPDPRMIDLEEDRAIVLGEFGGLGWPIKDHVWVESETNWGYRSHEGKEQYTNDYIGLITKLKPMIDKGLAAAVYTQTTDCEVEVNGLLTYDRKVKKLKPEEVYSLNHFYLPPVFSNTSNSFLDEIVVGFEADNKNPIIRYTTDGTDPTSESKEYKEKIKVTDDTTIKARAFWNDGIQSAVVSHTYTNYSGEIIKASDIKVLNSGLKYELYKGLWRELPDFENIKLHKKGTVEFFDLGCSLLENEFALSFSGYIKLQETAVYTFSIDSDDGTKLFIADRELVDNDGVHGMNEVSGEIALEAGLHKIKLLYFQGRGGLGLNVYYQANGILRTIIPEGVLFH